MQLRNQILDLLRPERIVRSWSGRLHPAGLLRITASSLYDEDRHPLFRDIQPEIYLAKEYSPIDHKNLQAIGLQVITVDQFLDRFRADLLRPDSRFKAGSTTITWHTRVVNALCSFLDNNWSVQTIKQLKIIPLHQGQLPPAAWISASQGLIFYPDCGGVLVPATVNLQIIDPSVCGILRNRLWDKLGVRHLQPAMGILHVTARFQCRPGLTVGQVIDLLYFLFWHLENTQAPLGPNIQIANTHNQKVSFMRTESQHLYFPNSAGRFTARALLGDPAPTSLWNFLNEAYMLRDSPPTIRNGRSWRQFLQEAVLASDHPRLLLRGTNSLSLEFKSIRETKSEQLVGLLWTYQALYLPEISNVRQDLVKATVPVVSGGMMELKDTVFPTTPIVQALAVIGVTGFPFLVVPTEMAGVEPSELTILSRLGVETSESLSMYLKALAHVRKVNVHAERLPHALLRIYEKLSEYAGGTAARERLRCVQVLWQNRID
jgi:hypothetical protein